MLVLQKTVVFRSNVAQAPCDLLRLAVACCGSLTAMSLVVLSPGLSPWADLQVAVCSGESLKVATTLLMALWGLASLTFHVVRLLVWFLDLYNGFLNVFKFLGFSSEAPEAPEAPVGDPPVDRPQEDMEGILDFLSRVPLYACDNVRRSHTMHVCQDCSQFKRMTRPWRLELCDTCAKQL